MCSAWSGRAEPRHARASPPSAAHHRRAASAPRTSRWSARSGSANPFERKSSGGRNFQLTVHLCLRSPKPPKAPIMYALGLARRKGQPRASWIAAHSATRLAAKRGPPALSSSSSSAGAESNQLAFTPAPNEYSAQPAAHRRWLKARTAA